ncbi:MAG: GNAT family N-acetyltransferase [Actinomycetota bacterium]|nr:GNAT family N-acetyltransferase [Actinomycetota bacterium]
MVVAVRSAFREDGPVLRDIERLAGERFRAVGLDPIADDEPFSLDELARYANAERSWVATSDSAAAAPVGYLLADVVDGNAHVEQMSVRPDHQGAGVGRALLGAVRAWAVAQDMAALTLTTFADVPWNAPLYRHLGFETLDEAAIGPELRAVRAREAAHGLDPTLRVCMRLVVAAASAR